MDVSVCAWSHRERVDARMAGACGSEPWRLAGVANAEDARREGMCHSTYCNALEAHHSIAQHSAAHLYGEMM